MPRETPDGYRSNSEIKQRVNTQEVRDLIEWFIESYDDGWRPEIHSPDSVAQLRFKMGELVSWSSERSVFG